MTSLPTGWATVTIADLGGTIGGKTPSKANADYWISGTVPWVSPKDMKVFELHGSEDRITESTVADAGMHLIPVDSVLLVTRSGILAHTLPVAVTKVAVTINQDIKAIRPVSGAHCSRYLAYSLRALESRVLNECAKSGTTVASVELPLLEKLAIPFAPLSEQQRIADKLDTVLARVDACRDRLARVAPLLKRFRQSVLAAAASGRLTEEWRAQEVEKAQRWTSVQLKNVARFIDYRGRTPNKTNDGVPLITAKNVRPGYLSLEPREYIAEADYAGWMTRGLPSVGDVLITTEAPLGNVVAIDWDFRFALAQRLICLKFDACVQGEFAAIVLQSPDFQLTLRANSSGSTVSGIKASRLKEVTISIPGLAEQAEIVRRVETLFAFADRLEARLAQAQAAVDRLTPSLLAKAFRGELVPQDPADEPAAELLKRMAASRAAPAPKTRKGRQVQAA